MRNVVLFFALALLASCAPREKLISKGWKFSDVEMVYAKDSAGIAFQNMAREQIRTNLTFEMESDSSYTIRQLKEGRVIRGKWWFSADKKHLYTQTELGLTESNILKLTAKSLVYETKDPAGKMIKMKCVATARPGSK